MTRAILLFSLVFLALLPALPGGAQLPAPRLAVSCGLEDSLTLLDARTVRILGRLPVCRDPGDLAASPDGRVLTVAEASGTGFARINLSSLKVVAPVRSPHLAEPRGLTFSGDGARLYVLSARAPALVELHVPSFNVIRVLPLQVPGPADLVRSRDEGRLYISHREAGVVSVVDLADWRLLAQHHLAPRLGGLDVTAEGGRVLVGLPQTREVGIFHAERFNPLEKLPAGVGVGQVRMGPGGLAVALNTDSNDVLVFDPDRPTGRYRIGVGRGPRAMAFSADGRVLYVANYNSDDVSVLDLGAGRQMGRLPVGRGPRAITLIP